MKRRLARAFAKYPDGFVAKYVKNIYVVSHLNVNGVKYGGTSSADTKSIYISEDDRDVGHDETLIDIERIFHQEFTSMLFELHRKKFDEIAWRNSNIAGFKYGDSGRDVLISGKGGSVYPSDRFVQSGFVSEYATAGVREDLCGIVALLMCGGSNVWRDASNSDVIKRKSALTLQFLHSIDGRMSWKNVEQLRLRLEYSDTMEWDYSR